MVEPIMTIGIRPIAGPIRSKSIPMVRSWNRIAALGHTRFKSVCNAFHAKPLRAPIFAASRPCHALKRSCAKNHISE
jgi:hypothetical protein